MSITGNITEKFNYYSTLDNEELRKRYNAFLNGDYDYGISWNWFFKMRNQNLIDQDTFVYATRSYKRNEAE